MDCTLQIQQIETERLKNPGVKIKKPSIDTLFRDPEKLLWHCSIETLCHFFFLFDWDAVCFRVWSVRYNPSHDQLLLTALSDTSVILSNIVSVAPQPFGHL